MTGYRPSRPLLYYLNGLGLSIVLLFSIVYLTIARAGCGELDQALSRALVLWSSAPWWAFSALFLQLASAVELSGTSMDPAIAVFGWTAVFYGVPYLTLAIALQVVSTRLKKLGYARVGQTLALTGGLANALFAFSVLLMPASWVAMYVRGLVWAASTA